MARDTAVETESTGVVAWLAAPPLLARDIARLGALIDDMVALLEPFNPRSIHTNEPRIYRLTPLGRSLLREAMGTGCANFMIIEFGEHSIPVTRVLAHIDGPSLHMNGQWIPVHPTKVEIDIATSDTAIRAALAGEMAAFVQQQSATLHAAAAFITQRGGGKHPGRSSYEYDHHLPHPSTWVDVERFSRGAFWAMFLGPVQCERLGGQDYVVRTAPVWRAEPTGSGVWLRTSPDFPETEAEITPLLAFLAPLLSWTKDDFMTSSEINEMYGSPQAFPTKWFKDVSDPTWRQQPLVPVRKLSTYRETDGQIVLNIYADGPLSAEQRTILAIALHTWQYDGHEDGFSGGFIAWMGFLSFSTSSVRCTVSLDYHDDPLRALQEYLSMLVGVMVQEIVLGIEEVG